MAEPSSSRVGGAQAELWELGKSLSALELVKENFDDPAGMAPAVQVVLGPLPPWRGAHQAFLAWIRPSIAPGRA